MKIKKFPFILFIFVNLLLVSTVQADSIQEAKEGVLQIDSSSEGLVSLGGKWEFYWNSLYKPEDFLEGAPEGRRFVQLPHGSHGFDVNGQNLAQTGHVTYRLQIDFPMSEYGTTKALYIPTISSAYTVWIDGTMKAKIGEVGINRESMKPESVPSIVEFKVPSGATEIVIQASNYFQRRAGMTELILIGEPGDIFQYQNKKLLFRTIIVTSLLIMGLYHLALFAFRRKEYSLIYFGLLCILVAIRATLLEEGLAEYVFTIFSWEIDRTLEYLGASLGTLFLALFTYMMFPEDFNKKVRNLITMGAVLFSLLIICTPALIFTRMMIHLQIFIMLVFTYLLFVFILAVKRKREGSLLNMMAMMVIFIAAINDFSFFNDLVKTMELSSVGMLFFLFTQSIIISKRYAMAYNHNAQLSKDLMVLNTSLEQKVDTRTMELHHSNKKLQTVNEKLEEAHQMRSNLISNIAHEIGAPLTSIQAYTKGIIDGVIQSERKYIQLIYEKSLYLSQILNDLRSMTDMETKELKYMKQHVDIEEFCQRIFQQNKVDLERDGIHFSFHHTLDNDSKKIVDIDPIRIEQVIVNFITNAGRYVPDMGKIEMWLSNRGENSIIIRMIDNGRGIKPEELDLIFNRFYSSRNEGKEHYGSGLGLSISKEIIEYHKGTIGVESIVNEGSCFYFTLPLVQA